jgi:hypothetical protein
LSSLYHNSLAIVKDFAQLAGRAAEKGRELLDITREPSRMLPLNPTNYGAPHASAGRRDLLT